MISPPTIKESMSSFIGNSEFQIVYEQANITDRITNAASPTPSIQVPFPPPISAEDLISPRKDGEVPSRSPNAFLIYRGIFVKLLKAQNYGYKMTDVSSMASASWKQQPEYVKQEYLRIAGKAKNMLTTTRHKSLTFSRRKLRNSNKNNNTRTPKAKTSSTSQSPHKKQQISQSPTQEPKQQPKYQFQPLNISQPIIDNIEDRPLFTPSFADNMEDDYLFSNFFWTQSPVSDVPTYSDGDSSPSNSDIFDQSNLPAMFNNYWAPIFDNNDIFDVNNQLYSDNI